MTREAGFFGPAERESFAVVSWPAGPAHGAVVVCHPLAYEREQAHLATRLLADRLADAGVATLRLDYPGTGNAPGESHGAGDLERWLASISDSVDLLLAAGFASVSLIGVRAGGLLAAVARERFGIVAPLAIWDAPPSGRQFVRRLRLFSAAGAAGAADSDEPGLVVGGVPLADGLLADLSGLRMPDLDAAGEPVLVVVAQDEPGGAVEGTHVESATLPGTSELFDYALGWGTEMPVEIVDTMAAWLAPFGSDAVTPPRGGLLRPSTTEVIGGTEIVHVAEWRGPEQVFTVTSEPSRAQPTRALITINASVETQIGPGRAWVEWAARLARDGVRVLRVDVPPLGNSGERQPVEIDSFPLTAGRDIAAVVGRLRDEGAEEVVLLGLCSGGVEVFDAVKAGAAPDVLIAINPAFTMEFSGPREIARVRAAGRTPRLLAWLLNSPRMWPFLARVPRFVWLALARAGVLPMLSRPLRLIPGSQTKALVIFGDEEWDLSALRLRTNDFERLSQDPNLTIKVQAGLDHAMLRIPARDATYAELRGYLTAELGWPEDESIVSVQAAGRE